MANSKKNSRKKRLKAKKRLSPLELAKVNSIERAIQETTAKIKRIRSQNKQGSSPETIISLQQKIEQLENRKKKLMSKAKLHQGSRKNVGVWGKMESAKGRIKLISTPMGGKKK